MMCLSRAGVCLLPLFSKGQGSRSTDSEGDVFHIADVLGMLVKCSSSLLSVFAMETPLGPNRTCVNVEAARVASRRLCGSAAPRRRNLRSQKAPQRSEALEPHVSQLEERFFSPHQSEPRGPFSKDQSSFKPPHIPPVSIAWVSCRLAGFHIFLSHRQSSAVLDVRRRLKVRKKKKGGEHVLLRHQHRSETH